MIRPEPGRGARALVGLLAALAVLCRAGTAGAGEAGAGAAASSARPPDVLLLTIDTLRPDYLSGAGYGLPTSPVMDSLAAAGCTFEEAVTPIARTTPAFASVLTGSYPQRHGVRTLWGELPRGTPTLVAALRDAGWTTLAVVTNNVLTKERGLHRGFDRWDERDDSRVAASTVGTAVRALAGIPAEQPVFAWVHLIDPHVPYHSRPAIIESFAPDYDGPYARNFGWQPLPGVPFRELEPFPDDLPKLEATHANPLPPDVVAHVRHLYAADIRATDDALPPLLRALGERSGGNLLIVLTSDHGESLGEHAYHWDHGDYVYEPGLRVPLTVIVPPEHAAAGARRVPGRVSLVDLAPTLFDLLGIPPPPELDAGFEGRSLAPAMAGGALPEVPTFAESGRAFFPGVVRRRVTNDVAGRFRAVTHDGWKLIHTPGQQGALAWELYDLGADPGETVDLWSGNHPKARELEPLLLEWMAQDPAVEAPEMSPEDVEALRSLGYVE